MRCVIVRYSDTTSGWTQDLTEEQRNQIRKSEYWKNGLIKEAQVGGIKKPVLFLDGNSDTVLKFLDAFEAEINLKNGHNAHGEMNIDGKNYPASDGLEVPEGIYGEHEAEIFLPDPW